MKVKELLEILKDCDPNATVEVVAITYYCGDHDCKSYKDFSVDNYGARVSICIEK